MVHEVLAVHWDASTCDEREGVTTGKYTEMPVFNTWHFVAHSGGHTAEVMGSIKSRHLSEVEDNVGPKMASPGPVNKMLVMSQIPHLFHVPFAYHGTCSLCT
jgi:hypothetical protein